MRVPSASVAVVTVYCYACLALAEPVSFNDPFRSLTLRAAIRARNPLCCLKPLPSDDTVDGEVLLSFEQWKARQLETQTVDWKDQEKDVNTRQGRPSIDSGTYTLLGASNDSLEVVALKDNASRASSSSPSVYDQGSGFQAHFPESVSPHFRVPLTDRFNYANSDCSARVHLSHRSAKSAPSILSSKRDRYMLSPCSHPKKEDKFVVVELCEDIRIDTVQLANFEFFSGVFKDFTVSVAKTYSTDLDGWTHAGTYRAKNVRGVQSFHPPTSLRDFYRYIRIDFHSHYGNEYYCPVSLLRVYGLTHLEQWKWDIWEAESRAKQTESEKFRNRQPQFGVVTEDPNPSVVPTSNVVRDTHTLSSSVLTQNMEITATPIMDLLQGMYTEPLSSSLEHSQAATLPSVIPTAIAPEDNSEQMASSADLNEGLNTGFFDMPEFKNPYSSSPSTIDIPASSETLIGSELESVSMPEISSTGITSVSSSPSTSSAKMITSPAIQSSPSAILTTHIPVPSTNGESIYRTIMNRLRMIETNHTLYSRYIEQQHRAIRDAIKKLGEDIGRLDGIARAQDLLLRKSIQEWEKQRRQSQGDYHQLMLRIEYISEEIILEKRLGIAQLCLLLAVLVFMGLTRGSRGEPFSNHGSVREWGKRHLSLTGEWATRFRNKTKYRSKSPSQTSRPRTANPYPSHEDSLGDQIKFPALGSLLQPSQSVSVDSLLLAEKEGCIRTPSGSRARTPPHLPILARRGNPYITQLQRLVTPTRSHRLQSLQRSNSHGATVLRNGASSGTMSRSARKWARTAHLHEVRRTHARERDRKENVEPAPMTNGRREEDEDVFLAPLSRNARGELSLHGLRSFSERKPSQLFGRDSEVDPWVDMDSTEVSENDGPSP